MFPITALTGSLLALVYIYLSIQIITLRKHHKVSIGGNGLNDLEMAIRAHGNFAEYVPLVLILMICAEASQAHWSIMALLGILFIAGRIFHSAAFYGINHFKFRTYGMVLTFFVLICLAVLNIFLVFYN